MQEAAPSETTKVLKQTAQTRRSRSPSGSSYSRLMMFGSQCRYRVLPVSFAYTPRSHGRGAARSPLQVSCNGRNPSGSMPDNTALCFIGTRYSNTVADGGRRLTYIHIIYYSEWANKPGYCKCSRKPGVVLSLSADEATPAMGNC